MVDERDDDEHVLLGELRGQLPYQQEQRPSRKYFQEDVVF